MDYRKRVRTETTTNCRGAAGAKRTKDADSISSGVGSKSKPCTKFFSISGCPYGEGCHFLHYVPGGINVVAQMSNLSGHPFSTGAKNPLIPAAHADGSVHVKTKICNKYNTPEGCKYGDKCHFAHGEKELEKHILSGHNDRPFGGSAGLPSGDPVASFGASSTAKISVAASLTGALIGKGGMHAKQLTRITGARMSIRDHESDKNLKNVELEGTFDQIKHASSVVMQMILVAGAEASSLPPSTLNSVGKAIIAPRGNFKTKLCDNFAKGSCTFGDRCHFAHGDSELRQTAA